MTYLKRHHSWNNFPSGVTPDLASAWLSLTASGAFFGPFTTTEGTTVGNLRGTWAINRFTGRAGGGRWFLRGGEYITRSESTFALFVYPGSDVPGDEHREGSVQLSEPYSFAQLSEDLNELVESTVTSIWLVPPGKELMVGRAEQDLAEGFLLVRSGGTDLNPFEPPDPWGSRSWLDGGPATGEIRAIPTVTQDVFRDDLGTLHTYLKWSNFMSRERCLVSVDGYFSTQVITTWGFGASGPRPADVVYPKEYWKDVRGRIEVLSPAITGAEAALGPAFVDKRIEIRLGDKPPAEGIIRDWPRVAGLGTC